MSQKVLAVVVLTLGFISLTTPSTLSGSWAVSRASTANSAPQSITSGTFRLVPLLVATDPAPTTAPGSINLNTKSAVFFVKNFGTKALTNFTLTQTNTAGAASFTLCRGQNFLTAPALDVTKCADNTSSVSLGSSASLVSPTFSPAIAAAEVLYLSLTKSNASQTTISISVSTSDYVATTRN